MRKTIEDRDVVSELDRRRPEAQEPLIGDMCAS